MSQPMKISIKDEASDQLNKITKHMTKLVKAMDIFGVAQKRSQSQAKASKADLSKLEKQTKKYDKELAKARKNLERYEASMKGAGKSSVKLKLAIRDKKQEIKKLEKALESGNKEIREIIRSTEKWRGVAGALPNALKSVSMATMGVAKSLSSSALTGAGKVFKDIAMNALGFEKIMRGMTNIGDIISQGIAQGTSALKQFTVDSAKMFQSLDTSARKTLVFAGLKDEMGLDEITQEFNKLAQNSLFSSEQIASAFEEIASVADFSESGAEGLTALGEAMVGLATATGTADISSVGETLAQVTNAFGLGMENAGAVANVLTKVANETALSVDEIGFAMQYVSGQANLLGMGLTETTALVGQLTNMGFSASTAGTSLAEALKQMTEASNLEQLEQMGVSIFDANGEMYGMVDILSQLEGAFADLSPEEKNQLMNEIFGTRGGRAIASLMNATDEVANLQATFEDLDVNALGEGVDFMMGGMEGAMQSLSGSFETIQTMLGEALAPALIQVATALEQILQSPEVIALIDLFGQLVAKLVEGLLPVLTMIIGHFVQFFGSIMANEPLMESISELFMALGEIIGMLLPVILFLVQNVLVVMIPIITTLAQIIGSVLNVLLVENRDLFMMIIEQAKGLITTLASALIPIIVMLLQAIMPLLPTFLMLISMMMTLAGTIIQIVVPIIQIIAEVIVALLPILQILMLVLTGITWVLNGVGQGIKILVDNIIGFLRPAIEWIASKIKWVVDKLTGFIIDIIDGADAIGLATDGMKRFRDKLEDLRDADWDIGTFDDLASDIMEADDGLSGFNDSLQDTDDITAEIDANFEDIEYEFEDQEIDIGVNPIYNGEPIEDTIDVGVDPSEMCKTFAEFIDDFRGSSVSDIIDLEELGHFAGVGNIAQTIENGTGSNTVNVSEVTLQLPDDTDVDDAENLAENIVEATTGTVHFIEMDEFGRSIV